MSNLSTVLFCFVSGVFAAMDDLDLVMPKYAIRGGNVTLMCRHSVPLEQLYKVEWKKGDKKIFQYIKGRDPPFRYFPMEGAELNVSISLLV